MSALILIRFVHISFVFRGFVYLFALVFLVHGREYVGTKVDGGVHDRVTLGGLQVIGGVESCTTRQVDA